MEENFSNSERLERLKAENNYMKMKLMLEKGANFGGPDEEEINPEIENVFLKKIIAFQEQFDRHTLISVFDKIEKPTHFRPPAGIPDNEIEAAWQELLGYINKYGIDLDVCSPNIGPRELYRFTIEELFEEEIEDVQMPGWVTCFIYDEFHPDPVYENTRAATEDCISSILEMRPMDRLHSFVQTNLRLNEHTGLSAEQFTFLINRFKSAYDQLTIVEINADRCTVGKKNSFVWGAYAVDVLIGVETHRLSGNWKVRLSFNKDMGYWVIAEVDMEGIKF